MYKCLNCGNLFEEGEEKIMEDDRGEFWGDSCCERLSCCPVCQGDFEEAKKCKICESYCVDDDLYGGVCLECLNSYKNDWETCYNMETEKEQVKINSFLCSIFTNEQINDILFRELKTISSFYTVDCSDFIDSDKDWFGQNLVKFLEQKNEIK